MDNVIATDNTKLIAEAWKWGRNRPGEVIHRLATALEQADARIAELEKAILWAEWRSMGCIEKFSLGGIDYDRNYTEHPACPHCGGFRPDRKQAVESLPVYADRTVDRCQWKGHAPGCIVETIKKGD